MSQFKTLKSFKPAKCLKDLRACLRLFNVQVFKVRLERELGTQKTMPRANRHFLPGYVWHITFNAAARSNHSMPEVIQ